jgi:hypothetical protein
MVKVQTKDGETYSMTPKDAAIRASHLNAGVPDEPSAQKHVYRLVEDIIRVCREAMRQKETPANQTVKSVSDAVDNFEAAADIRESPMLSALISAAMLRYPALDRDDIKSIYTKDNISDKFKEDLLSAANKERIEVWNKDRVLTPPL